MRIETEVKLDYSSVLLRPKRSTLGSRKEVDLKRGFTFRNYNTKEPMKLSNQQKHYSGIPLVASNMDGVGTCLLYTSPSPRDGLLSRMPSSA